MDIHRAIEAIDDQIEELQRERERLVESLEPCPCGCGFEPMDPVDEV